MKKKKTIFKKEKFINKDFEIVEKIVIHPIITYVLSIIVLLFSIYFLFFNETKKIIEETIIYEISPEFPKDTLDKEEIKKYIKDRGILYGDILYAQILIESGNNLNSYLAVNAHNLLGMKIALRRPTTSASNSYKGYAIYRVWRDCINDYVFWQEQNAKNIKTRDEYLDLLGRTYAEDKNYIIKINEILKNIDF